MMFAVSVLNASLLGKKFLRIHSLKHFVRHCSLLKIDLSTNAVVKLYHKETCDLCNQAWQWQHMLVHQTTFSGFGGCLLLVVVLLPFHFPCHVFSFSWRQTEQDGILHWARHMESMPRFTFLNFSH
jgi:hypothetical protein